jgi:hypothetical protein
VQFFCIIFYYVVLHIQIANTERSFLKLCLDSLKNLKQNSKKLDKILIKYNIIKKQLLFKHALKFETDFFRGMVF